MKMKWQLACLSLEVTASSYGKKALASDMNVWVWGVACQKPQGLSTLLQCAIPEFMTNPLQPFLPITLLLFQTCLSFCMRPQAALTMVWKSPVDARPAPSS